MKISGSIEGVGELFDNTNSLGSVKYRIDVRRTPGGLADADGVLVGEDAALVTALNSDRTHLILQDGSRVVALVTQHSWGSGQARIIISGPVPGFS